MIARGSLLAGAGVGAGLTYFLDPARGARRRARVRDTLVHSAMITRRAIGTASRDIAHRTYGTAASLRSRFRHEPVDDQVLVDRLRAKLGRLVWHPHAIEVSADQGRVTLRGPILTREADHLVRAVERIDGVHQVVDHLERHEQAGNIPALQGGRPPAGDRIDLLRTNWAPTTRVLVGAAGAALAIAGLTRRDRNGDIAAVLGAGLVACAATNLPANRFFDWRIDHDRFLQPE